MAGSHIRFNDDIGDEYNLSDSDDDYTQEEKNLLKKHQRQETASDSEDEVYGVGSGSDDPLSESDVAVSDIDGLDDKDDLPDVRAWGKDKRKYYATDYVDPDYGGYQGKDATLDELEVEEAKNLHKLMIQQLDDDDFNLDLLAGEKVEEKPKEEVIKTDTSKLSKRQKREIFDKTSPEFMVLLDDTKAKMSIVRDFHCPVMNMAKDGRFKNSAAVQFVKMHYELILNYCNNVNMYLMLKSSGIDVKTHPVMKRLYQYRQLLSQMDIVFHDQIKPQIELLLEEDLLPQDTDCKKVVKRSDLKVLRKLKRKSKKDDDGEEQENAEDPAKKRLKKTDADIVKDAPKRVSFEMGLEAEDDSDLAGDENMLQDQNELDETDSPEKRSITYQMAKNKGLTPHRKREQRNPRVKHRNKFRKAKIRRKGAVREVRHELSRYGGEISGIKASVSKSIKIKS